MLPPAKPFTEQVILVDENDQECGTMEKLQAHQEGMLHRAISVFIFHTDGRLMLQKRAQTKYHSGGLWSNTCCSHPRPGESPEIAATRRLAEEMGIYCPLSKKLTFIYRATFSNGLIEHEYDHVFVGISDAKPRLNLTEAEDWRWMSIESLRSDMQANPEHYTYWLQTILVDIV